ncbi:MAG TPA: lysine--tRNA ligase [Chloroflexia bacterium]|jgi:lysyl-tRNA synthetase class 2
MTEQQTKQERAHKAAMIREMKIDPYPYKFELTHSTLQIKNSYDALAAQNDTVSVAGRIMARRDHGRTAFLTLQDSAGTIQVYIRSDDVGAEQFKLYSLFDIGDIIGVQGVVFRTKTNEVTIRAYRLQMLCKALRTLPDKWHGLRDVETRYRQRYLDLIMNPDVRKVFLTRTRIINTIRHIFNAIGGIEVETPTLQPLYGGASARPFKTHHNALDAKFYMRIADELYLKRLIVGGFDCVYEICKDFRNEGMDRSHNPEFTMVEIYWAYKDYNDMMDLTERLFVTIAHELIGGTLITYQGETIDLTPPWPRRPMLDLIKEHTGIKIGTLSDAELLQAVEREIERQEKAAKDHQPPTGVSLDTIAGNIEDQAQDEGEGDTQGVDGAEGLNRGKLIEELFGLSVEPRLVQPTFVIDYPKETSPLAKTHRTNPTLTERFELYICRREMANAFSELNDPLDQRERFEAQMRQRLAGDEEAQLLDEDFLRALEYGMPPTGGLGIGVDRLVMLFTDQPSIQDVILFPQMRPEPGLYEAAHEALEER